MADLPETDETQESGESREIKLAQTDTKTKQESTITDESRQKTWQQANTQGHARDPHPSEIEPDFHANTLPKAKEAEHLRGYENAYPTGDLRVLSKSVHVQNVESQYKFLH